MSLGRGKWENAGGGIQFFILIISWYFGVILAASISKLVLGVNIQESVASIRLSNAIGSIFLFLIPAILYAFLFIPSKKNFLTNRKINILTLLLGVLAIFCIQPLIETANFYNDLIRLPESMASTQEFLDNAKVASEQTMRFLFEDKTMISFSLNILVMAIFPGVLEELFFRGCMQRSLYLSSKNIHVAIWTTALIFSLLHFQLTGFIPRILLGALLGYLYAWNKNIWIPIAMHTFHNASVVVYEQLLQGTELYDKIKLSDYNLSHSAVYCLISLSLTAVILIFVYRRTRKEKITESLSD